MQHSSITTLPFLPPLREQATLSQTQLSETVALMLFTIALPLTLLINQPPIST